MATTIATRTELIDAVARGVDRLCVLDDLGLPDHEQREATIQKIEQFAKRF